MEEMTIDGKVYRYVELRGRGKWISRDGDAINPIRKNQKAKWSLNCDGYPCFGGAVPVHLYVAHAWVDGYFDGAEVNHKDFDRMNFNADNLEWVTHEENIKLSVKYNSDIWNGSKQGTNNGRATFNDDDIIYIRNLYDSGKGISDIIKIYYPDMKTVKQYHSIWSTFANICHRRTWKCVC